LTLVIARSESGDRQRRFHRLSGLGSPGSSPEGRPEHDDALGRELVMPGDDCVDVPQRRHAGGWIGDRSDTGGVRFFLYLQDENKPAVESTSTAPSD